MTDRPDRPDRSSPLRPALVAGVWALPVFGALLTLSTLTHQPDDDTDFSAYADYVTAPWFLPSHLVGSILGAGIGIVGTVSAAVLVAGRPRLTRAALVGAALSTLAHVLNTAVFGVAAFAQPALGRAHQAGLEDAVAINADVYGPETVGTVVVAFALWTAGAVLLGRTFRATHPGLRAAGAAYAVALPLFYLSGPAMGVLQPVFGAVFTAAAVVLARRLPAATADDTTEPRVAASATRSLLVLVAGPYRSGTDDDPDRTASDLAALEEAAWPLLRAGHVPVIGEWVALPVLAGAGIPAVTDPRADEVMSPTAARLVEHCDAVLRLPGRSTGADQDVALAHARGLPVYHRLEDVPGVDVPQQRSRTARDGAASPAASR